MLVLQKRHVERLAFDRHGIPVDVLRIEEAPVPENKADELIIRMLRRLVNPYELALISGGSGHALTSPQVPGFEGVGVVEHIAGAGGPFRVLPGT